MKRFYIITLITITAAFIVLVGSFVTIDRAKYNNGFVRVFPPHAADFSMVTEVTDDIQTIFDDPIPLPGYVAVQPISNSSSVLQSMNFSTRENLLAKSYGLQKYILKKQVDGLLCTDGVMRYSPELNLVVYTYRYRNQFICLDTNLNVVRFGKTIDTTSVAKISVSETKGKITMAKPPLIVNLNACIYGKYLFVNSNLMARNESVDRFKDNSVLDVYNLWDGSYRFSFYIENHNGKKMEQFKVSGSIFIAAFRDKYVLYDIPLKYFH